MKCFQEFRLDTVNHCLWRGEDRLPLAPKAFDVLRYLVEHSERLVTQEEILESLWPGTYVNPEVVKKYVLEIRKVLGDRSDKPVYIATFPRRGYQFIANVREETAEVQSMPARPAKTIVGRDNALAELREALQRARCGQRQVIFVTGEAGIGKTTLVDAFEQMAGFGSEIRIARGQCVEGFGGKEAYYPVLDALGHLLREADGKPILQAFARRAPTWLVQFPDLVDSEKREALEKEIVGATRERMVREICEALELVTAQEPLALFLEDLHWVDPSTLDFLSALARRRGHAKLLLIGTYRPADVIVSQSPLRALKQDLAIHDLACEISLERLEASDVAEYLQLEFQGANFPEGFADTLYHHSGGNALFMVTILQDMVKKGLLAKAKDGWTLTAQLESGALSVPETLDQLVESQFQQLSALEQRVLRSASVAGEHFSAWAIGPAAQMEQAEAEEVCERLAERQQFIKFAGIHELTNGQISAHYDFLHSFYREVLYRRLSEVSRSRLHLLLAQRLQAFCDPCEQEIATELALHFEGGYDHEQAIKYLIMAAENAMKRFAYRDAIEILEHALELAARLNPPRQAEYEVRIYDFTGYAYFALGALPESAQAYDAAADKADRAGLKTAQVEALISAMYPLGFINPAQGLAAIERAVQMSANSSDSQLMKRAKAIAAGSRLVFDDWSKADAELCACTREGCLVLCDGTSGPYPQMIYAHVLALQGRYREAIELVDGILLKIERGSSLLPHFGAVSVRTLSLLRMGRLGEVLEITRRGRQSPDENMGRAWLLTFREAWLRVLAFDYEGAQSICQEITDAQGEYHPGQPDSIGGMAAGYLELERGNYARATKRFEGVYKPRVVTKFFLHWIWRMTAHLELANTALLGGDFKKARALGDGFLESALATDDPHLQALAWELQARLALGKSDLRSAQEHIQQAIAIVEKSEVMIAAWKTYATAWQVYQSAEDHVSAESNRRCAEACIRKIADTFQPDEPLRATFLGADPVRRVINTVRAALN